MTWNPQAQYNIDRWSDDFFHIDHQGRVCVLPYQDSSQLKIPIESVIEEIKSQFAKKMLMKWLL